MKKILLLLGLSGIFLTGCTNNKIDEAIFGYHNALENYGSMTSYKLNLDRNLNIFHLNENNDIIGERNSSAEKTVLNDFENNSYYMYVTDNNNYETATWFINGTVYLNNDGYKVSYNETLENFKSTLNENSGIIPVSLTIEDVESVKTSKIDNKYTYDFKLNQSGREKLLKENNYLGFGQVFKLKNSELTYKVVCIDDYIREIYVTGVFVGESYDETNKISFEDKILISEINNIKVDKPINFESYTSNNIEGRKEYQVNDIADYKVYLTDIGYNEQNGLYNLTINNQMYFSYDFENMTYSLFKNKVSYVYDYNDDIGYNGKCIYSYSLKAGIEESTCTNRQIYELLNVKNSFNYDINQAGINDIEFLKTQE